MDVTRLGLSKIRSETNACEPKHLVVVAEVEVEVEVWGGVGGGREGGGRGGGGGGGADGAVFDMSLALCHH